MNKRMVYVEMPYKNSGSPCVTPESFIPICQVNEIHFEDLEMPHDENRQN